MIHSMTAYARREIKGEWGTGTWEVRSVNQRYLETFIRAPEQFRGMEPVIRERLRKHLQRGKVEVFLKFVANPAHVGELSINQSLAEQLINSAKWVQQQSNGDINPVDILRWPGVMEAQEVDMDSVNTALITGLDQVIEDFKSARGDEGANLEEMIATRLTAILEQVNIVEAHMPEITKWQREKLVQKLEDLRSLSALVTLVVGDIGQQAVENFPRAMKMQSLLSRAYGVVRGVVSPRYVITELLIQHARFGRGKMITDLATDPDAFEILSDVILKDGLTNSASDTIVDYDATYLSSEEEDALGTGAFLEINNEIMLVSSLNTTAQQITVKRAARGTTIDTHATGDTLKINPPFSVKIGCRITNLLFCLLIIKMNYQNHTQNF